MTERLTIRRLYWLLAVVTLSLAGIWVFGHSRGGAWPDTWLPNFIAEAAGIFFTVAIVEVVIRRNLESDRDANVRPIHDAAAHSIVRVLEGTILRHLTLDWINDFGTERPPAGVLLFIDEWRKRLDVLVRVQVDLADVEGSWITRLDKMVERTADKLADVRMRYAGFLPPRAVTALDDFIEGLERDQDVIEGLIKIPSTTTLEEHQRALDKQKVELLDNSVTRLRELVVQVGDLLGHEIETATLYKKTDMELRLVHVIMANREEGDDARSE